MNTNGGNGRAYTDHWAERLHAMQRLSISVFAVGALGYGFIRVLEALVAMCHALQ